MLKKIKIGPKLIGSFAIIACLSIAIVMIGIMSLNHINQADKRLYEKITVPMGNLVTVASSFHQARIILRDMVRTNDATVLNNGVAALDELVGKVGESAAVIEKTILTEDGKKTFEEFIRARKQFKENMDQIIALAQAHKSAQAYAIIDGPAAAAARAEQNAIDKFVEQKTDIGKKTSEQNQSLFDRSTMLMIVCLSVGLLIVFVLCFLLVRSITVPLSKIAHSAQRIADGNIDEKIDYESGDEIGFLADCFRALVENLTGVIQETQTVVQAAGKGVLEKRTESQKYKGSYQHLLSDINVLMDSIATPMSDILKSLECLSNNDTTTKITGQYSGIWENAKTSVNTTIQRIEHVVSIVNNVSRGDLSELDALKKSGKRSQHDELVPGVLRMMESVKLISDDINHLAQAAIEGNLDVRTDTTKHSGDFQTIVTGLNGTLDSILVPIKEAMTVLDAVAARNLTARVKGDYKGDHAKLKQSVNATAENLDLALTQVSEATEQVSSASQQISSGSQSLAQGTNEQASSLEEVSSSLEEMSSMTKQNAENANQAKNLAAEANGNASVGTAAMTRMSDSINKIKDSSDQTAKIVKTIDEIAMQTNLLALNAAVEAARAGEAGRGFAVVAEEVRNLAQRSAQAAKSTADMISESVKNAEDGVKIAVDVSKSFDSIVTSVKKVNDLITEIAAASQEQSQGIDQVNTAVAEMDKVTQQNAANSEESASAAEEMSSQAEELQNMVAQFSLSQSAGQRKTAASVGAHHAQGETVQHKAERVHKQAPKNILAKGNGGRDRKSASEQLIPMDEGNLKSF